MMMIACFGTSRGAVVTVPNEVSLYGRMAARKFSSPAMGKFWITGYSVNRVLQPVPTPESKGQCVAR